MSTGELAVVVFGLATVAAIAGALAWFIQRPPRPDVRLTIAPRDVPTTRATTLATIVAPWASPIAPGGPAEGAVMFSNQASPPRRPEPERRTTVLPRPKLAADNEPLAGMPIGTPVLNRERVAVPIEGEEGLDFRTLIERHRAGAILTSRLGHRPEGLAATAQPPHSREQGARADADGGSRRAMDDSQPGSPIEIGAVASGGAPPAPASGDALPARVPPPLGRSLDGHGDGETPATGTGRTGTLETEREALRQRCSVAERLKRVAETAAETLRSEQRAYDACVEQIRKAEDAIDGRAIRAAKDVAQREFSRARAAARTPADVELAARTWLRQIDTINREARGATSRLARDRQAVARLLVRLERLSVEADAARIDAEAAGEECLAARQPLAALEQGELEAAATAAGHGMARGVLTVDEQGPNPAVVRILQGDHAALREIVDQLAGSDPAEVRRWQLQLVALVDGLVARAIEMAWFDFPVDHPFWGMFSPLQDREIAQSLASLGYRFDGLGGFADGRVPGQRELSLALGYAGLDPMRIRRWPDQAAMAELYRDVRVQAAEFVAAEASSLSLGELIALLGQRAEPLTDLWDAWGRVRPLLLARS